MTYEVVNLDEKILVGLTARTSNTDPKMGEIIGGLWQRLFGEGIFFALQNKVNDRSIGLYSNYESDMTGKYDITVGCEVSSSENAPANTDTKIIPAGRYAKFIIFGDEVEAVGAAWGEIWSTKLDRTYTGDFEEYLPEKKGEPKEIHIYMAIK